LQKDNIKLEKKVEEQGKEIEDLKAENSTLVTLFFEMQKKQEEIETLIQHLPLPRN
jgi:hypothetical protein